MKLGKLFPSAVMKGSHRVLSDAALWAGEQSWTPFAVQGTLSLNAAHIPIINLVVPSSLHYLAVGAGSMGEMSQ